MGRKLSGPNSQIVALAERIEREMHDQKRYNGYIDKLQYLITNREESDLKGLHEKLNAVARGDELNSADRDLLAFEQLLEKYTHYQSAQILFTKLLMRILTVFEKNIMPPGLRLNRRQVDEIIYEKIIQPTMEEMDAVGGKADLFLDEGDVYGMINWLAERCHIRWQAC